MATITGTEGNDDLSSFPTFGSDGTIYTFNYLDGLGGNDTLTGIYGSETLNGGLGDDFDIHQQRAGADSRHQRRALIHCYQVRRGDAARGQRITH